MYSSLVEALRSMPQVITTLQYVCARARLTKLANTLGLGTVRGPSLSLQLEPENRHQVPSLVFLGGDADRHNQVHESARIALARPLPLQAGAVENRHGALAH